MGTWHAATLLLGIVVALLATLIVTVRFAGWGTRDDDRATLPAELADAEGGAIEAIEQAILKSR